MPLAFIESGSGAPLLMLNGYAASAADWEPAFVDALATSSRVIRPDHRGIGDSLPLSDQLTIAVMARDVVDLMDSLGIEQADVLGWSMGGFVAQQLAAAAPHRVGRLVLLATDMGGADAELSDPEIWSDLVDYSGTPREQAARLLRIIFPPELGDRIFAEFGDVVAAARALLRPETLDAQMEAILRWHTEDATSRLAGIVAPTLIASGTADVVIPVVNSRVLAPALPGSRLETFDGCGHAFIAQEPERLAALIAEWVGRA